MEQYVNIREYEDCYIDVATWQENESEDIFVGVQIVPKDSKKAMEFTVFNKVVDKNLARTIMHEIHRKINDNILMKVRESMPPVETVTVQNMREIAQRLQVT